MKYLFSALMMIGLMSCSAQKDGGGTYTDVSNQEAKQLMAEKAELQIIDVRTDGEVAQGMIEGAVQMDISKADFETQLASLDKSKPVLVYCAAGGRSKNAQDIMKKQGFSEVHNLKGGYSNWKE